MEGEREGEWGGQRLLAMQSTGALPLNLLSPPPLLSSPLPRSPTLHSVVLGPSLRPDTVYYYRIAGDSLVRRFKMPPAGRDAPINFAIVGEWPGQPLGGELDVLVGGEGGRGVGGVSARERHNTIHEWGVSHESIVGEVQAFHLMQVNLDCDYAARHLHPQVFGFSALQSTRIGNLPRAQSYTSALLCPHAMNAYYPHCVFLVD